MRTENIISLNSSTFADFLRFPDTKNTWDLKLNSNLYVGCRHILLPGHRIGAPYAERSYEKSDFSAARRCAAQRA